jgi:ATP-dependent Clp protease, protease subunit
MADEKQGEKPAPPPVDKPADQTTQEKTAERASRGPIALPEGGKVPKAIKSRIMAEAKPQALPIPVRKGINAFVRPQTLDRWSDECAGVRPVEALAMGDNVITMFDQIGESFWSDGVTAKRVAASLRAIGDRPVEVHINSPGGDMFEGIAIYNVLMQHPQDVTIKVMGMAASAASVIAMAGNRLEIGAASFLMIHNCWVIAAGNRHEFAEVAAYLQPFDTAMAGLYAARSGQSVEAMADYMDGETFFSGQQAIDLGLADALLPANQVKVDETSKDKDKTAANLRSLEISLMASRGMSRTEARAEINKLRGTTDSAPPAGTTDSAGTPDWIGEATSLLAAMKK